LAVPLLRKETVLRTLLLCTVTLGFLSGCAPVATKPISTPAQALLENQSMGLTVRADAHFNHVTAGAAAFGALGLLASRGASDDIAVPHHIADPSHAIAAALAGQLAARRGARLVPQPISVSDDDPAQVAAAAKASARFVIDVRTVGWGVSYLPSNWTHYSIGYRGTARLIDTETGTVLAEGSCSTSTRESKNPPTYDELKENDAALVKTVVAEITSTCARRFESEMLGLEQSGGEKTAITAVSIPPSAGPHEPIQAPINGAANPGSERWNGIMACGPLSVTQPGSGPYQAIFEMEVNGSTVTVHRKSAHVVETLEGEVIRGQLQLEGRGYLIDNPAKRWGFQMQGSFENGAPTYTARGYRIANGKRTRECALRMMRA
jgi:hypothetical protein